MSAAAVGDALVGQVFNILTPAAVGSDAYRVAIAGGVVGGRARIAALVILERALGVTIYSVLFLAAYALARTAVRPPRVFDAAAASFGLLTFGLVAGTILAKLPLALGVSS